MTTGDDDVNGGDLTPESQGNGDDGSGRHALPGEGSGPAAPPPESPVAPVHSDVWVPPESVNRPPPPHGQGPAVGGPSAQGPGPQATGPQPAGPQGQGPRTPGAGRPTAGAAAAAAPAAGGAFADLLEEPAAAPARRGTAPKARVTERKSSERRLAYWLVAPAAIVMLLVTGYPIIYAFWLSLNKATLTAPDQNEFIWFSNYATVLSDSYWWNSLWVTVFITVISVIIELVLGMAIAMVMHRTIFGKGTIRTVVLIPYGIVTVAAAFSWYYAWTPGTGYLANLLPDGSAPLTDHWQSLFIIILAEVWKTTPFMALLLLAGLALVPDDLLKAAQVDGAGGWTRLWKITIPLMKPAILVALLFRTLDAFRIFDNIYILTKGNHDTGSVSMLGYNNLFKAFNLGVGSAISILIFLCVAIIAFVFIKIFGASAPGSDNEGR